MVCNCAYRKKLSHRRRGFNSPFIILPSAFICLSPARGFVKTRSLVKLLRGGGGFAKPKGIRPAGNGRAIAGNSRIQAGNDGTMASNGRFQAGTGGVGKGVFPA
jgi:hypothetical protein